MSKLTTKFPILSQKITLKVWEWILFLTIGNTVAQILYDITKWLLK